MNSLKISVFCSNLYSSPTPFAIYYSLGVIEKVILIRKQHFICSQEPTTFHLYYLLPIQQFNIGFDSRRQPQIEWDLDVYELLDQVFFPIIYFINSVFTVFSQMIGKLLYIAVLKTEMNVDNIFTSYGQVLTFSVLE